MSIIKLLDRASEAYYSGMPIMSDNLFDTLAKKYGYNKIGEPSKKGVLPHKYQMYSLQKVFEGEDTPPFSTLDVVVTPKLDGAAISLLYEEGFLSSALKRGNGVEGEDILDKIYLLPSVPKTIPCEWTTQITGEIVAPKEIKNSRNYAAGALNLKNLEEFSSRQIIFIAYGLDGFSHLLLKTYYESMEKLNTWGFNTVLEENLNEKYPTDGVVVRINNNLLFEDLGYTANHPRGAYALKRREDVSVKETILLKVDWQIGKGGKVTPVAIFEEVEIEDAKINRATLHNIGFIEELDLHIGDTLLVTRSGGIIPKVIGKL